MSSRAADPSTRIATRRLSEADIAFAMAWEVHAPGLGGWTVQVDTDDDGTECLHVDPPLVYGDGFTVWREAEQALISWSSGSLRVGSVRDAMLTICPLSPEALEQAEVLAAAPELRF